MPPKNWEHPYFETPMNHYARETNNGLFGTFNMIIKHMTN